MKSLWILINFSIIIINLCGTTDAATGRSSRDQTSQTTQIAKDGPILTLAGLGKLRGRIIKTAWTKKEVKQFVDVKYAESPGGLMRFKAPVPVQPWEGIRDATEDGIGCPSILSEYIDDPFGNFDYEDCLSMTVSSGNLSARQPVMVYLHGEYLYEGNNLEGAPEYLLEKDIVLISLQYRLGPFGFLSTNTQDIPGNAAIFDVILALQWIKHFVPYFGGDPNRVTVMGQVSGAAIAHLLTFSPVVPKGLFHRVIYHSGSALMPSFLTDDPVKFAKDIGEKAGCASKTIDELNYCLITLSSRDLMKGFILHAQANLAEGSQNIGGAQFTIGGPSGVLPEHPSIMLLEEKNISIPSMGGTPRNIGSRLLKEIFDSDFSSLPPDEIYKGEDYINHFMLQTLGNDPTGVLTTFLSREFFTTETIRNGTFKAMLPVYENAASVLINVINLEVIVEPVWFDDLPVRLETSLCMLGSIVHKVPVLLALQRNAKHLPEKTYLYSFDYRGQYNRYPDFDYRFATDAPMLGGVSLTDENIYLFPYPDHVMDLNDDDKTMAMKMIDIWTSFVATGEPALNWPSMNDVRGPYLKIDRKFRIGRDYFTEFTATVKDEKDGISLVKN